MRHAPIMMRTKLVVSSAEIMRQITGERGDYRYTDREAKGGRPKSGLTPECEIPGCVRTQRKRRLCEPHAAQMTEE